MKAFIFDLINKLQRTNNTLDAKAILCNKTWRVFSDSGEKEVYIFMEDGKLIISLNGNVDMGTWMYIPANQSLVITGKQNYLVHPVICNNILALVVDGTNQCAFLLDDTKRELEAVKSLQGISSYISSNINKLPHIKSLDNPNRLTVTNGSDRKAEFVYDNEIDCYCVDLRHIKRIEGRLNSAKYTCDLVDISKVNFAVISDDLTIKNNYLFGLSFIGGHYSEFIYHSIKNQAAAHIVFNYKKTFGIKYDYTKVVWYFNKLTRFTDDMIDQSTWLMNYGADLKKDIEKHKDILTSVLGFSDIYGLFDYWKYREDW